MKLNELMTGDVAISSNGDIYRVMLNTKCGNYFVGHNSHNGFTYYDQNMESKYDKIMKVYRPKSYSSHLLRSENLKNIDDDFFDLIFERESKIKEKDRIKELENIIAEAKAKLEEYKNG